MTTLLEVLFDETDFRKIKLNERDAITRVGNSGCEFVFRVFYNNEEERLVRFWTAKRNGNGIRETHYSVNSETGKPHLDFVRGYEQDKDGYSELNEFLGQPEKLI